MNKPIRLLISYSHDSPGHQQAVLNLAQRLRRKGIDAWLDRFESFPEQGWQTWMRQQIKQADFVLLVCTKTYQTRFEQEATGGQGKGVSYEGMIISQQLYDDYGANKKFIPVVLEQSGRDCIPTTLRSYTNYVLAEESGLEALYRLLTNQPEVSPEPLGNIEIKAPANVFNRSPLKESQVYSVWQPTEEEKQSSVVAIAQQEENAALNLPEQDLENERLRFHQLVRDKITSQLNSDALQELKNCLEDSKLVQALIDKPTTFSQLLLQLESSINTELWLDHFRSAGDLFHCAVKNCLHEMGKDAGSADVHAYFWDGARAIFGWLILLSVQDGCALRQKLLLGGGVRFEFKLPIGADNVVCVEIITARVHELAATFNTMSDGNVVGASAVPSCPEAGCNPEDAVQEIIKAIYKHLNKRDAPKTGINSKKLNAKLAVRKRRKGNYYVTVPVSNFNNPLTNENVRKLLFEQLPNLSAVFIGVQGGGEVFVTEEEELAVIIEEFLELYREKQ